MDTIRDGHMDRAGGRLNIRGDPVRKGRVGDVVDKKDVEAGRVGVDTGP